MTVSLKKMSSPDKNALKKTDQNELTWSDESDDHPGAGECAADWSAADVALKRQWAGRNLSLISAAVSLIARTVNATKVHCRLGLR